MMKTAAATMMTISPILSPPNPKTLSAQRFSTPLTTKLPHTPTPLLSPFTTAVAVKCRKNGSPVNGDAGSLKDALSGMVGERVEELLNKEENRGLLDGLEQASRRVEMAKRELAEIERQEIEAKNMREYVSRLESRAAVIAECQKEIFEARMMLDKAEQSLANRGTNASGEMQSIVINQDVERLESLKAAFVSAVIGTLAEFPITLTRAVSNSQLILPLAITFISCTLFGVTFRYAVRRDLDNFQLKSGTSAAFGFVKGLGMLSAGLPMEMDTNAMLSNAFDGAVSVSENLLIFLFAGVALELCMKLKLVSPFPMDQSVITSEDMTDIS